MYTFYLFIISMFGFIAFYAAAMLGVGDLAEGRAAYGSAGTTLSLALAVGAVWFWHWRQLLAKRSKLDEDGHSLIHFHLFLATSMLALGLVVHGRNTIEALLQIAAGLRLTGALTASLAAAAVNLALTVALWVHHRGYLAAESEYSKAAAAKRSKK